MPRPHIVAIEDEPDIRAIDGLIDLTLIAEGANGRLVVSDTGIGIEPQHVPRLFERFYRVDSARSREQGGTGLGLAIVKHVAQASGGKVTVESVPGKGSCFTVSIPLSRTGR